MKARRLLAATALVGIMAATGCSGNVGTNADKLTNNAGRVATRSADRLANNAGNVARGNRYHSNRYNRDGLGGRITNDASRTTPRNYGRPSNGRLTHRTGRVNENPGTITPNTDRASYNSTNYKGRMQSTVDGVRRNASRIANNVGRVNHRGRYTADSNRNHNNVNHMSHYGHRTGRQHARNTHINTNNTAGVGTSYGTRANVSPRSLTNNNYNIKHNHRGAHFNDGISNNVTPAIHNNANTNVTGLNNTANVPSALQNNVPHNSLANNIANTNNTTNSSTVTSPTS